MMCRLLTDCALLEMFYLLTHLCACVHNMFEEFVTCAVAVLGIERVYQASASAALSGNQNYSVLGQHSNTKLNQNTTESPAKPEIENL